MTVRIVAGPCARQMSVPSPGSVPWWVADFTTGIVPDAVRTGRASAGWKFGPDGLLGSVGNDLCRLDYSPLTLMPKGVLVEEGRTNLVLWNRDLTQAAWGTKTNVIVAKDQVGLDGVAASASRITATGGNAVVMQAVTSASATRVLSAYVRRLSGTGTVEMTLNGGATWTAVTVGALWGRVVLPVATVTNPAVGFRLAVSGDAIAVDFVQCEAGGFATSVIGTGDSAVTRATDNVYALLEDVGYDPEQGVVLVEFERFTSLSSANPVCLYGAGNRYMTLFMGSGGNSIKFAGAPGSAFDFTVGNFLPQTLHRAALAYAHNDFAGFGNGALLGTDMLGDPVSGLGFLGVGCNSIGGNPLNGWVRRVMYAPVRLENAQVQTLTA